MIDKVQKIREEVARIQLYTQSEVLKQVLDYIDEVQKEPVSEDNMIEWNTDMPQGDIIAAKIEESFCNKKDCYEVLCFASKPYPHYYDAWCEEIPYSAIEKWALIK